MAKNHHYGMLYGFLLLAIAAVVSFVEAWVNILQLMQVPAPAAEPVVERGMGSRMCKAQERLITLIRELGLVQLLSTRERIYLKKAHPRQLQIREWIYPPLLNRVAIPQEV